MKAVSLALLTVIALALPTPAAHAEWKDKNNQINQTNFILMSHGDPICSTTLISLKYKLVLTAHHCLTGFISTKELDETQPDGTVKKVTREVLDDVTVAQKSYQGYQLVGDANYSAVIVAHERKVDMGLLQLRADTIPQTIASKVLPETQKVQRGDRVWVVGNPLGILDATLTSGIVSSTTRMMKTPWADDENVPFIQTDAAINSGNSGGALYNDDGQLIGIPDAGWRGANNLSLALTPESIRGFLTRNCWADVIDDTKQTHDACIQAKKDAENKHREKLGLPPKE